MYLSKPHENVSQPYQSTWQRETLTITDLTFKSLHTMVSACLSSSSMFHVHLRSAHTAQPASARPRLLLACTDRWTAVHASDSTILILLQVLLLPSPLVFPKHSVSAYCLMSSVSTSSETIISRELWLITITPYVRACAYHRALITLEVIIHSLEQWFP